MSYNFLLQIIFCYYLWIPFVILFGHMQSMAFSRPFLTLPSSWNVSLPITKYLNLAFLHYQFKLHLL